MEILFLTEEDIRKVFTMEDCIDACQEALLNKAQGGAEVPLRTSIDIKKYKGTSLYMPAYDSISSSLGLKIVSTYPENRTINKDTVSSTMVLLSEETGEVISILDGGYLTRLRTGAVSALGTKYLSRKDSKKLVIFGTGGQAMEQVEGVLALRDIEEITVFGGSNRDRTRIFAEELARKFRVKTIMGDDRDKSVAEADIIITVTSSSRPVFNGEFLKEGSHINAIGSYKPSMEEIDLTSLNRSQLIYVDSLEGILAECGDFLGPIGRGEFSKDRINGEIADFILENKERPDNIITIFNSVGTGVLDVVVAKRIYEKACEAKLGRLIK